MLYRVFLVRYFSLSLLHLFILQTLNHFFNAKEYMHPTFLGVTLITEMVFLPIN